MIEPIEPKALADGVGVFCAHDKIVDTDALVSNPRNPNKHPKEQIAALAKIIKRQGWRHPIVVSNRSGFVVKGHGRLLAAKELGVSEVPVDYQDYESEASEYADLMADNKIQEFSELDMALSADILKDIRDSGDIELEMSAFTEEALNELLAKSQENEVHEDNFDVEAELEKPCFSKPGDIWCIGRHRVICGDSTEPTTYDKLLGDTKVNLVCTDPPYMVNLESTSGKIKNDDLNDKDAYAFLMKAFNCLHDSMATDASIYVFYATAKGRIFHDAFEDAGFKVGAGLVWKKDRLVLTRTDWKYIHEPILWGWRKDGKHDKYRRVIWQCNNKFKNKKKCTTPHFTERELQTLFVAAVNKLLPQKAQLKADFELIKDSLFSTDELQKELNGLQKNLRETADLLDACIERNAHEALDQNEFNVEYEDLTERYLATQERMNEVSEEINKKRLSKKRISDFLKTLYRQENLLTEFDGELFGILVEWVTVYSKEDVRFTFINGMEI